MFQVVAPAKSGVQLDNAQKYWTMFVPAGNAARPASPLGRATARPVPGEKILGGDTVQPTTVDGQVLCLQRPAEAANRDIPGGMLAIPVTCSF